MSDVTTAPVVRLSDAAIRRRMIADFWFYFRQNRGAVIGLAVFILLVLVAVLRRSSHRMIQPSNIVMRCWCRRSGRKAAVPASSSAPTPSGVTCCPV